MAAGVDNFTVARPRSPTAPSAETTSASVRGGAEWVSTIGPSHAHQLGNVSGNTATAWGGGVSVDRSSATLTNCTIRGNSAVGDDGSGGGMYNSSGGTATLVQLHR